MILTDVEDGRKHTQYAETLQYEEDAREVDPGIPAREVGLTSGGEKGDGRKQRQYEGKQYQEMADFSDQQVFSFKFHVRLFWERVLSNWPKAQDLSIS